MQQQLGQQSNSQNNQNYSKGTKVIFVTSPSNTSIQSKNIITEEFRRRQNNHSKTETIDQISSIHSITRKKSPSNRNDGENRMSTTQVITSKNISNASKREQIQRESNQQIKKSPQSRNLQEVVHKNYQYEKKINDLQRQKAAIASHAQNQKKILIESNGEMRKTIEKLYEQLNILRKKLTDQKSLPLQRSTETQDSISKIEIMNNIIQSNEAKIYELQTIILQKNKTIQKMIEQKKNLQKEAIQFQIKCNILEANILELSQNNNNSTYIKVLENIKKPQEPEQLHQQQSEINSKIFENKLQDLISQKSEIQFQYKNLEKEYSRLIVQNQHLKQEYKLLQSKSTEQYQKLRDQYHIIFEHHNTLKGIVLQTGQSFTLFTSKLETEIGKLKKENSQILEEKATTQYNLTKQLQKIKENLNERTLQCESMKNEILSLNNDLQSKHEEHEKLMENLKHLEAQKNSLTQSILMTKCNHIQILQPLVNTIQQSQQQSEKILAQFYKSLQNMNIE